MGLIISVKNSDILIPIIVMVIGSLGSWVGSWVLYGFGEIIERVTDIERNTRGDKNMSDAQFNIKSANAKELEKLRSQGLITVEEYRNIKSKKSGDERNE